MGSFENKLVEAIASSISCVEPEVAFDVRFGAITMRLDRTGRAESQLAPGTGELILCESRRTQVVGTRAKQQSGDVRKSKPRRNKLK